MRLDDLKKLEAAATPGPWVYKPQSINGSPWDDPDDELTVAARNAIPDLLAIARAAEAHVAADDELLRMLWVSDDCEEKAKAWMASETARGELRAALAKLEGGGT